MFFFLNDTATTEIYTLSLHDALPICQQGAAHLPACDEVARQHQVGNAAGVHGIGLGDRKSTRLNSSHGYISYAVFCLKKKTSPEQTKGLTYTYGKPSVV